MTFSNGMMERREPLTIRCVEWASVSKEEQYHGGRANGSSAMNRILSSAVANAGRGFVLNQDTGSVEVLLGGYKV